MNNSKFSLSPQTIATLETSSVHLVNLTSQNLPGGIASGCLMDYKGSRLLLTVAHAVRNKPPLALQIGWDPAKRKAKLCRLNLSTICSIKLPPGAVVEDPKWTDIDFAFGKVEVDDLPQLQEIDENSGRIVKSRDCTLWTEAAIAEPKAGEVYGFAGRTMPRLEDYTPSPSNIHVLSTTLRVVYPLTFVGEKDGICTFQLPIEHPGHEYFRGCSGAPIIDMNGNIVALVCFGVLEHSLICGVSVRHYADLLDIEAAGLLDKLPIIQTDC